MKSGSRTHYLVDLGCGASQQSGCRVCNRIVSCYQVCAGNDRRGAPCDIICSQVCACSAQAASLPVCSGTSPQDVVLRVFEMPCDLCHCCSCFSAGLCKNPCLAHGSVGSIVAKLLQEDYRRACSRSMVGCTACTCVQHCHVCKPGSSCSYSYNQPNNACVVSAFTSGVTTACTVSAQLP